MEGGERRRGGLSVLKGGIIKRRKEGKSTMGGWQNKKKGGKEVFGFERMGFVGCSRCYCGTTTLKQVNYDHAGSGGEGLLRSVLRLGTCRYLTVCLHVGGHESSTARCESKNRGPYLCRRDGSEGLWALLGAPRDKERTMTTQRENEGGVVRERGLYE